jgi:hypothetical protein
MTKENNMTNKHIEVVKRWVDGESLSVELLKANSDAAWAAEAAAYGSDEGAYDDIDDAAYEVARAAWDTAYIASHVAAGAAHLAYVTQQAIYSASGAANADAAYADAKRLVERYEEIINGNL